MGDAFGLQLFLVWDGGRGAQLQKSDCTGLFPDSTNKLSILEKSKQ